MRIWHGAARYRFAGPDSPDAFGLEIRLLPERQIVCHSPLEELVLRFRTATKSGVNKACIQVIVTPKAVQRGPDLLLFQFGPFSTQLCKLPFR
ncbi:hypothetical protein CDAR_441701 [Caerostris darwini]|uniref:Uncharacterized protein n=1 Tax=Caerostris darwini TaxID=1538125 RepID=A0AAV4QSJ0_9ARAC|nr:hypothetical protein CDAR_441701 [Caerostris darwini]